MCFALVKRLFELTHPKLYVTSITDLDRRHYVITAKYKDGTEYIPGYARKVHKLTGHASAYPVAAHMPEFQHAIATRRHKTYNRDRFIKAHLRGKR